MIIGIPREIKIHEYRVGIVPNAVRTLVGKGHKVLVQKSAGLAAGFAYETVTDDHGRLPILKPMSEVAGRIAIQTGAHNLEMPQGGRGILLGGIQGVQPAKVVVIGAGCR